jgi:hypothetical protein
MKAQTKAGLSISSGAEGCTWVFEYLLLGSGFLLVYWGLIESEASLYLSSVEEEVMSHVALHAKVGSRDAFEWTEASQSDTWNENFHARINDSVGPANGVGGSWFGITIATDLPVIDRTGTYHSLPSCYGITIYPRMLSTVMLLWKVGPDDDSKCYSSRFKRHLYSMRKNASWTLESQDLFSRASHSDGVKRRGSGIVRCLHSRFLGQASALKTGLLG